MTDDMSEKERLVSILNALNLPRGQYLVGGSGAMILRGIPRHKEMSDLDLFVSTALWFQLYESTSMIWGLYVPDSADAKRRCDPPYLYVKILDLEINVFFNWRRRNNASDIDVALYLNNPENVEGWPCIPLQFLIDWKTAVGRSKDVLDVGSINHWLDQQK
jgi:hypothetical protein